MSKLATFGAGCFWGVEKSFKRKFPNLTTYVGYCGGADQNADYRKVCTGQTGHAEVIQVQGSFEYFDLVDFFFRMHDPTTANRQGNDAGSQYRSVIFYHDDHQKEIALNSIEKYQANFGGKIKTTVEKYSNFIKGEDYHQDYLTKNPHGYECATHFERSWEKIRELYAKY